MRDRCRICGCKTLVPYLDLGHQPLANALLKTPTQKEKTYPLSVQFCATCSLSQLTHVIDPEVLYRDYLYRSGTPMTFRDHCRGLAEELDRKFPACRSVLDIASNDGTLLKAFKDRGKVVQGIDPACGIVEQAVSGDIPTLCDFWPTERLGGVFDVIVSMNVLAHVGDVHGFVEGVKNHLSWHGMWVIEVPYVGEMVKRGFFDTIYHEHLSYFTLLSLKRLIEVHHGLDVFDVDFFPDIHGGTMRVWVSRGHGLSDHGNVKKFIAQEKKRGLFGVDIYRKFGRGVLKNKSEVKKCLKGRKVWAYGAAAKGATLLNTYGITHRDIPVVIDDNAMKWGYYMPGSKVKIVGINELKKAKDVDAILILAWNFKDEIINRCEGMGYRGKFIVP